MLTKLLSNPSTLITFNEKGHMTFDNYDLVELSKKYPTPFYVFSEKKVLLQYNKIKKTFNENFQTDTNISFPVRINPTKAILTLLYQNGSHFTASSIKEINLLSQILQPGQHHIITYHSPILTKKEIRLAIKKGIKRFIIDSEIQLDRLNSVAKKLNAKPKVLIDLDTGVKPRNMTNERSTSLNIYNAISFFEKANDHPNIILEGIYNNLGDQNTDIKSWVKNIRAIAEFALRLFDLNIEIKHLNLGSGLPLHFPSNIPIVEIAETLSPYLTELKKDLPGLRITLEPGLYISAPAGVLLTKIRNIKEDNLYVNASIFNTVLHSKLTNTEKPIIFSAFNSEEPEKKYNIRGNRNSPHDLFEKNVSLPLQEMHNLLVFFNAGAYLYSSDYGQAQKLKTLLIRNK